MLIGCAEKQEQWEARILRVIRYNSTHFLPTIVYDRLVGVDEADVDDIAHVSRPHSVGLSYGSIRYIPGVLMVIDCVCRLFQRFHKNLRFSYASWQ